MEARQAAGILVCFAPCSDSGLELAVGNSGNGELTFMGLDTSHNCWHGPYSAFMRWRKAVAAAAGIPDLEAHWTKLIDPTYDQPKRPLMILLNHSDCDGVIESKDCGPLADDLESILNKLDDKGPWQWSECGSTAKRFIAGLRAAAAAGEDVEFS
jgi:hypothetical protein